MYSRDRLVILDADGTTIDAFSAIHNTFAKYGMNLGDLERFQRRRNPFKYLGGLKEFSGNLRHQLSKKKRNQLLQTLTEFYREECLLYPGIANLMNRLIATPNCKVGILTRNVTIEPEQTLSQLYKRQGVEVGNLDFLTHISIRQSKTKYFHSIRELYQINPARSYACGDERIDYLAARSIGAHPFMVSYGFEGYWRLVYKIGVPVELISKDSYALCERLINALDLYD